LNTQFIDLHNPDQRYLIRTHGAGEPLTSGIVSVKSYADILGEYQFKPERKLINSMGKPCGRRTVGKLYHPSITISNIRYIGKEGNYLEEREAGLLQEKDFQAVYMTDEWKREWIPLLKGIPTKEIVRVTGLSKGCVQYLKKGRSQIPQAETMEKLKRLIEEKGLQNPQ
jgi:hypothetical protein